MDRILSEKKEREWPSVYQKLGIIVQQKLSFLSDATSLCSIDNAFDLAVKVSSLVLSATMYLNVNTILSFYQALTE